MATPISQIPLRIKGQTTCIHHKGRQLEFYCEKCQELVCPKCLSSIHKAHPVSELSEITPQKEPDIKNFIDRTEKNDLVQIGKYITTTDTLLKDNTSTFEKLSQKLKMQTDKLKQKLDMLTAQTLSLYHKMEEDNTKLIKKYKQDLEMYEKQLKQQIQECKAALQRSSHIQIYDTYCEIHSPTYSLPVKPVLGTANFTPNESPQDNLKKALGKVITSGQGQTLTDQDRSVSTSDDLGQPSTQQQRSETKVKKAVTTCKLLPQTKVVEELGSPCYIDSTCPTTDGQVWTSFWNSRTLTLLDRKGIAIQEVNHNAGIYDISLSPTTHTLWVCDRDNHIMELVSGRLTQRFSTKKVPSCICVTASNHVIVGMTKHISKFTTDGKMVCTTMVKGTGKPLVCTPDRISECPVTHNVPVTDFNSESDGGDGNKHVVVMDTDFKELFVYRGAIPSTYRPTPQTGGIPFYPRGVEYDSVGNLIIGDGNNKRVLLISGGGEFLRVIYTDTVSTWAVGIDREDVLWAVFGSMFLGKKVKLLQYSSV
ncbi:tripartite motif-containing protein 2-like [Mizuhopecten yessoensis]|uniref:tripartite motif-containing protein 2-like n=1 Tax=Mizuhopecten yessoensis TaxID=6573 RepID=UPI000B45E32F|nr:tripartite motif-containing protein 2-like [Mizuhopecten yessoensis]